MPQIFDETDNKALLARVDERTKQIIDSVALLKEELKMSLNAVHNDVARAYTRIDEVKEYVETFKEHTSEKFFKKEDFSPKDYVKKTEFNLIARLVYGIVSLILIAFFSNIINTYIPKSTQLIPTPPQIIQQNVK